MIIDKKLNEMSGAYQPGLEAQSPLDLGQFETRQTIKAFCLLKPVSGHFVVWRHALYRGDDQSCWSAEVF